MITAILNGYKRAENLNEQLDALNNQSLRPDEILFWYNNPGDDSLINHNIKNRIAGVYCTHNFGVWARFAFAFMARNPYVCIFDDDTIPGRRWLENCMETMKTHEGLLGTVGLRYSGPASSYYDHYVRFGWIENGNNNDETVQVDFVGHSWFFKKEWLSHMWREVPDPKYNICGEDMHFSYMLQKYAGINTYVPPHPSSNIELWGSTNGVAYGRDANSLWESNQVNTEGVPFRQLMNEYFIEQRQKGWRLVNEQ